MKSNRQARHILGLDYRISNQRRKVVTEGDTSSVVNNPTGRKRRADSQK
ncbi:stationary-phase-induced ribosome-associated protein [Salmonella enterica]|nr:stationary-phase-induced ribosome-associated protein [Salmonella enterica]ECC8718609.1 stationary-phase-induced ribosome-associated protein [Salmonella enterica subsp. houtenae]EDX2041827.1 stationary-phase-induced ribosome-associated protein [Salmonella enterica subsp. houtenae serovar 50:z4,z23:-]HCZ1711554.1 stationary-phase-induced ribosome-associated protein [Salmonella enterica subsp. enterica serovar Montevideo str. 0269]EAB1816429.1 stationary-phase-induced ribosome-associated protei